MQNIKIGSRVETLGGNKGMVTHITISAISSVNLVHVTMDDGDRRVIEVWALKIIG